MRDSANLCVVAVTCLLIAATGTAHERTVVRALAVAPITVDGDVSDWKDVPILYLDKGPRVTAIAHDDRYLYVTFRFSDLTTARRVLLTGAIVWINGEGKHVTNFGLRYRGTQAAETALRTLEGGGDVPKEAMPPQGPPPGNGAGPQRVPLGALEVMRSGVSASVIAEGATPDGPAAACQVKDGVFVYEFRVPLAEIAATAASVKAGKGDKLAVGFQMGGPTEAELAAMRERMRSKGGPPGGGPQGGSGGGPQGGFGGSQQGGFGGGPPGGFGSAPGGFGGGRGGPGVGGPLPGGSAGRPKAEETTWLDVELVPASAAAAKSTPQER